MEIALVILFVAVVFIVKAVKVVPQQHAWVVERLGRFHAVLAPGLNIVVPFIDRIAYRHMLKEVPLDVPSQICITKDNTIFRPGANTAWKRPKRSTTQACCRCRA